MLRLEGISGWHDAAWKIDGALRFGPFNNVSHVQRALCLPHGSHTFSFHGKHKGHGSFSGYWELLNSSGSVIAGGKQTGKLHAVDEARFFIAPDGRGSDGRTASVIVIIHTASTANRVSWKIDNGPTYGSYGNSRTISTTMSLFEGMHVISFFDSGNIGWSGGFWEIKDNSTQKTIAGGSVAGRVRGAGGEAQFCVGRSCAQVKQPKQVKIKVHIHTEMFGNEISWSLDNGKVFGPYEDTVDKYYKMTVSEGSHTISYYDSNNDGWYGGYWEVLNGHGHVISGGLPNGLVNGNGGETTFCLGNGCQKVGFVRQFQVVAHIHTELRADEIRWSMDGGPAFGPYANNEDKYVDLKLSEGQHTMSYVDTSGDGWQGGWWEVQDACGKVIAGGKKRGGTVAGSGGETMLQVVNTDRCLSKRQDLAAFGADTARCNGSHVPLTVHIKTKTWANEMSWKINSGSVFGPYADQSNYYTRVCISAGLHTFSTFDSGGDGWSGGYWELLNVSGSVIAGGKQAGQVIGAGDENHFFIAPSGETSHGRVTPIIVTVRTTTSGKSVSWKIDDGTAFGPYSNHKHISTAMALFDGMHVISFFDSDNTGWSGGFWEIKDNSTQKTIAGGSVDGQVTGAGGEVQFCVGRSCAQVKQSREMKIKVHIHTEMYGNEITWSLDDGKVFGPYKDTEDKYYTLWVSEGSHTIKYIDALGDGWYGGYWEVLDDDNGHVICGGLPNGLVNGNGGETTFCVGSGCATVGAVRQFPVVVHIHTAIWATEIKWNIDGGAMFGPYANNEDKYVDLKLSEGQHTMSYMDVFGDGWHGGWWEVQDACGQVIAGGKDGEGLVTGSGGETHLQVRDTTRCLKGREDLAFGADTARCNGSHVPLTVHIKTKTWANEMSWKINSGSVFGPYADQSNYYTRVCISAGLHTFSTFDSGGDGWSGGYWELLNVSGSVIAGGKQAGQVIGAGDENHFFIAPSGETSHGRVTPIIVTVRTTTSGKSVSWKIDDGTAFGPYSNHKHISTAMALFDGMHVISFFDSDNTGWSGGFWEIKDNSTQKTIAGGSVDGQVTGAGGEVQFCVGRSCAQVKQSREMKIKVHIHTEMYGNEITWSLDDGKVFGPYKDTEDKYYTLWVSEGSHTIKYIDALGDGWYGGYWEVLDDDNGHVICGGLPNGLVNGNGGETTFCVGSGCATVGAVRQFPVVVHIHTAIWATEIKWNIDGGAMFGPYANNEDKYVDLKLSEGQHTMSYMDVFGDGWHGGWWEVQDACGQVIAGGKDGEGLVTGSGGEDRFMVAETDTECAQIWQRDVKCSNSSHVRVTVHIRTRKWASEIIWEVDQTGWFGPYTDNQNFYIALCMDEGKHIIRYFDGAGDGWSGGYWEVLNSTGYVIAGGKKTGQVVGAGGESYFSLAANDDQSLHTPISAIIVCIHSTVGPSHVSWKIDDGATYGPYPDNRTVNTPMFLFEGAHKIAFFDSDSIGWSGGFWEIKDNSTQKTIAGGPVAGQVKGAGGEAQFCVGKNCAQMKQVKQVKIQVHIRTNFSPGVTWSLDNGQVFGPYANGSVDIYENVSLPEGEHVLK